MQGGSLAAASSTPATRRLSPAELAELSHVRAARRSPVWSLSPRVFPVGARNRQAVGEAGMTGTERRGFGLREQFSLHGAMLVIGSWITGRTCRGGFDWQFRGGRAEVG